MIGLIHYIPLLTTAFAAVFFSLVVAVASVCVVLTPLAVPPDYDFRLSGTASRVLQPN
jgi:hypothetical protein